LITTDSAHATLWLGSSVARKASSEKAITASRKNPTACETNTLAIMPMILKFQSCMAFNPSTRSFSRALASLVSDSITTGSWCRRGIQNPAPVSAWGAGTRIRA
jgi:hypothetical protein